MITTSLESVSMRTSEGSAVVRKIMSPVSTGRLAPFWLMVPCPSRMKLARNSARIASAACSARCWTRMGVDSRFTAKPPARKRQACKCRRGCRVSGRKSPGSTSLSNRA
ncbi:hypothetical protein D3C78_1698950 [compost metagenome]